MTISQHDRPPKSWNLNKAGGLTGCFWHLDCGWCCKIRCKNQGRNAAQRQWLDTPEASCSGQNSDWSAVGERFPPSLGDWTLYTRCGGTFHIGQRSIFKYFQPIFGWCVIMLTWHLQNTNPVHLQTGWGHVDRKFGALQDLSKMASLVHPWSFKTKVIPKSFFSCTKRKRFGKSSLNTFFRHKSLLKLPRCRP